MIVNIVPQPGKLNTVADALSRRCDYVHQLWHIYHKSNVFSVQVITSRELSSRVNETFYVDDDVEAMTSQLNRMSINHTVAGGHYPPAAQRGV